MTTKATAKSLDAGFKTLSFVGDRTPESTDIDRAFCELSEYRDGAIYLAHYAGNSEWEKHPNGDEIVMVVEGETTLFLLVDGEECPNVLSQGQLFVVPQDIWHRFETPDGVKIMSVTPQPTEHSVGFPE